MSVAVIAPTDQRTSRIRNHRLQHTGDSGGLRAVGSAPTGIIRIAKSPSPRPRRRHCSHANVNTPPAHGNQCRMAHSYSTPDTKVTHVDTIRTLPTLPNTSMRPLHFHLWHLTIRPYTHPLPVPSSRSGRSRQPLAPAWRTVTIHPYVISTYPSFLPFSRANRPTTAISFSMQAGNG